MRKTDTFAYDLAMRIVKGFNIILLTVPFTVCWYLAYADQIASPYYAKGNYLVIGLFAALYLLYGRIYEAFNISMNQVSEIVYSQGLAALMLARRWYFHTWVPRRTLIIYDQRQDMAQMLDEPNMRKKFNIVQSLSAEEALSGELPDLEKVDAVFLCGVHSHERNILLKECFAANEAKRQNSAYVSSSSAAHGTLSAQPGISFCQASDGYLHFADCSHRNVTDFVSGRHSD